MSTRSRQDSTRWLRKYFLLGGRALVVALRWTFLALGAVTASAVLFVHLYAVDEEIYDPSLFAIGVGGLFAASCGVMLLLIVALRRRRVELVHSQERCEQLADQNWELQEAAELSKACLRRKAT